MDYPIIRARIAENRLILHELHSDEPEKNIKYYTAIRAGLHWPTEESPGYVVFLGEEYLNVVMNPDGGHGPLRLLIEYEYQGLKLDEFLKKITDDATMLLADTFYAAPDEQLRQTFWDYCDEHSVQRLDLLEAPFHDRFLLGLNKVFDLDFGGDLRISKLSLIYQQLQSISKQDLALEPETKFWRVDALRHVVCGFFKNPPILPSNYRRTRPGGRYGWMRA